MTPAPRLAVDLDRLRRHACLLADDCADVMQTIPEQDVAPYDAVDELYRHLVKHVDRLARETGHALDAAGDDPEAGVDDDYWTVKERVG